MRHMLLRFTYGVELGAHLAYLGHYERTNDTRIQSIALDEYEHQKQIVAILGVYNKKPLFLFNWFFLAVGHTIKKLCAVSPKPMLNIVAQMLEIFAVVSYNRLAQLYPEYTRTFWAMADTEAQHEEYFRLLRSKS